MELAPSCNRNGLRCTPMRKNDKSHRETFVGREVSKYEVIGLSLYHSFVPKPSSVYVIICDTPVADS